MNTIGNQLERYRVLHGLNRLAAAAIIGVDVLTYINFEEGAADIGVGQLLKLCAYYQIEPEEILKPTAAARKKPASLPPPETPELAKEAPPAPTKKAARWTNKYQRNHYESYQTESKEPPQKKLTGKDVVEIYAKHGDPISEEDAEQVLAFISKMAEFAINQVMREAEWQEKLADHSDGYAFEERGYTCRLCHGGGEGQMWYDHYGLKCRHCQEAINKGIIPGELTGHDELFYTANQLDYYFNLDRKTLTTYIRGGLIKERAIPYENNKGKYLRLFLLADNPKFFPPKESLNTGQIDTETIDGKEWQWSLKWYEVENARDYIKDYGISKYLKITGGEENDPADSQAIS